MPASIHQRVTSTRLYTSAERKRGEAWSVSIGRNAVAIQPPSAHTPSPEWALHFQKALSTKRTRHLECWSVAEQGHHSCGQAPPCLDLSKTKIITQSSRGTLNKSMNASDEALANSESNRQAGARMDRAQEERPRPLLHAPQSTRAGCAHADRLAVLGGAPSRRCAAAGLGATVPPAAPTLRS